MSKPVETKQRAPEQEGLPQHADLQIAYQVHTLTQLLYGHLVAMQYSPISRMTVSGYEPVPAYPIPTVAPFYMGMWGDPMGSPPLWPNPLAGL